MCSTCNGIGCPCCEPDYDQTEEEFNAFMEKADEWDWENR